MCSMHIILCYHLLSKIFGFSLLFVTLTNQVIIPTRAAMLIENPSKYTASSIDVWILKDFREDTAYEISLDESGVPGKHTQQRPFLN